MVRTLETMLGRGSRWALAWATLSLGALVLAGCQKTIPIKTLLDDPGGYDGRIVHVAGQVTSAVGVLGYGAYRLDDGTGSILVITKTSGAPREGARVGVEGTFRSAFTLGTETAAVIQEDKRTGAQ